jgi:glycerol-1-phosphate dehydrogenase [NAD(P)+]
VLAAAPLRLRLSGLGDSVCRSTAQADWLLAHLLAGRPYREAPFVLLAEDEEGLFAEPEALHRGDLEAVARLARTLVLSGFGMSIAGGSQPASQAEHLISHYVDMLGSPGLPQAMHGERIGVTTLTMARLQERLLGGAFPTIRPTAVRDEDIVAHFGPELGAACCQEFAGKRLDAAAAQAMNERIAAHGEEIRARIASIMRPSAAIERTLRRAGAATSPGDLHLPRRLYLDAVRHARELRDRYTFLDLAGDSGHLGELDFA